MASTGMNVCRVGGADVEACHNKKPRHHGKARASTSNGMRTRIPCPWRDCRVSLAIFQTVSLAARRLPPWIWGPEDSENLLILVHGYLACPGRWGVMVKELKRDIVCGQETDGPQRTCGRYRVMAVTMPGHGYKWEERPA